MKKIQITILAPIAFAVIGAVLLTTGYALGQDTPENPLATQPEKSIVEQQATELKGFFGDDPFMQGLRKSLTTDQLEVFLAYTKMRVKGYKIVDVDRFVNSYEKGKTDPLVMKEIANIGISQAKEGDAGPLLLANIVLQQRQIEQNDQIIALLQEGKTKK